MLNGIAELAQTSAYFCCLELDLPLGTYRFKCVTGEGIWQPKEHEIEVGILHVAVLQ